MSFRYWTKPGMTRAGIHTEVTLQWIPDKCFALSRMTVDLKRLRIVSET